MKHFTKVTGKTQCQGLFLLKLLAYSPQLYQKRDCHRCLFFTFTKLYRIAFSQNTSESMLLNLMAVVITAWKVPKYEVFSDPYFPVFYSVNLLIQSENGKIRPGKNSVFGHFSHNTYLWNQSAFTTFNPFHAIPPENTRNPEAVTGGVLWKRCS